MVLGAEMGNITGGLELLWLKWEEDDLLFIYLFGHATWLVGS